MEASNSEDEEEEFVKEGLGNQFIFKFKGEKKAQTN